MKVEIGGLLARALGNFWCVRGYATLGELEQLSQPDESFQRNLIQVHRDEITSFLSNRRFLFFPEVVLGANLDLPGDLEATLDDHLEPLLSGASDRMELASFRVTRRSLARRSSRDARAADDLVYLTLRADDLPLSRRFSRIDGNHRISAATIENHPEFRDVVCPFSLVLFRNRDEASLYSRAIFHNINAKAIPLRLEQNLKLILDEGGLFSDQDLKESSSFGWAYYFARKIAPEGEQQLAWLPDLRPVMENPDWKPGQPESERYDVRSRLLELIQLLLSKGLIAERDDQLPAVRKAISTVHTLYANRPELAAGGNAALFAVLVAHRLRGERSEDFIVRWALQNQIVGLRSVNAAALYDIIEAVLRAKRRKIFVSMPFGNAQTDGHWIAIQETCRELNDKYKLDPPLEPERVDLVADGTSYVITDKILEMLEGCGLLLADLTLARPNVYHEVGVVMGRNRALGSPDNLLLLLHEDGAADPVAFNLKSMRQLRFKQTHELKPKLRDELQAFFSLGA